jgi:hypothetical protein
LATLVFFGPALLRTRMEPGADERAETALRLGAGALTVAAVALLLTGFEGTVGLAMRLVAAAGLGVLTWAAAIVVLPVHRAAERAKPYAARGPVLAMTVWLPVALAVDVTAVATGQRRWLEVAGVLLLIGVLAQALLAVLVFLMPNLRGRGFAARERLQATAERGAGARAFVLHTGVAIVAVAVALGPAAGPGGAFVIRVGWAAVALGLLANLAVILRPRTGDDDVAAAVARRYGP